MTRLSLKIIGFLTLSAGVLVSACKNTKAPSSSSRLRVDDVQKNPLAIGVKLDSGAPTDANSSPILRVGIPKTSTGSVVICESKTQIKSCSNNATILTMVTPQDTADRQIWSSQSAIAPDTNGEYFAVEIAGKLALGFHLFNPKNPTPSDKGDIAGLTAKEIEVIDMINQYHKDYKLAPCKITAELNGFAKDNSRLQDNKRASGHYTSHPFNGEIAYYGPVTAEEAFVGWRASPGHDNLMKTGFKKCGVSAGSSGRSWTVSFKN